MSEQKDLVRLDTQSLKALAHPLRLRLLNLLREQGPATATDLARRVGDTTSGTTSYHLRRLAAHGFVVAAPEHSAGRRKCWTAAHRATNLNINELLPDPETHPAMRAVLEQTLELHLEWLWNWLRAAPSYGRAWADSVAFSDRLLRLTPARTRELISDLREVMARYTGESAGAGVEPIAVLLYAFPRVDLDADPSNLGATGPASSAGPTPDQVGPPGAAPRKP